MKEKIEKTCISLKKLLVNYEDIPISEPGFECSIKDCKLVSYLFRNGPQMMTELSRELHLNPASLTLLVDMGIQKKLVRRVYKKKDMRKIFVTLENKGEQIAKFLQEKDLEFTKQIFNSLDGEEQDYLASIMEKLDRNLSYD